MDFVWWRSENAPGLLAEHLKVGLLGSASNLRRVPQRAGLLLKFRTIQWLVTEDPGPTRRL